MSRVDIIDRLYARKMCALDFNFEMLAARPLLSLLTPRDIEELRRIAISVKLSSKPKEKYTMIDNILVPRGFKKIASGTNRVAYKYLEDQSIVLKVAFDKVGMKDNPREFLNQYKLKPFVTKVFEVSPCGTVGLFERVVPITTIEEYVTIAEDVFKMIVRKIIGKYVVDDIGTDYFQNIGVRKGFGPVLLDFPYVYELDGNKIYCNAKDPITNMPCGGEIDYDSGYNKLICKKCGKRYFAHQLANFKENNKIQVRKEGEIKMSISIKRSGKTIRRLNSDLSSDVLPSRTAYPKVNQNCKDPVSKKGISVHRVNKEVPEEIATSNSIVDTTEECNSNISVQDFNTGIPDQFKSTDADKSDVLLISGVDVESGDGTSTNNIDEANVLAESY